MGGILFIYPFAFCYAFLNINELQIVANLLPLPQFLNP